MTHWKRPWCWERLKVGGAGDDRGWDGWMASLTQWTWVWASSGSWWRREAWCAAVRGVAKDWTRLSDWTELNYWARECVVAPLGGCVVCAHLMLANVTVSAWAAPCPVLCSTLEASASLLSTLCASQLSFCGPHGFTASAPCAQPCPSPPDAPTWLSHLSCVLLTFFHPADASSAPREVFSLDPPGTRGSWVGVRRPEAVSGRGGTEPGRAGEKPAPEVTERVAGRQVF